MGKLSNDTPSGKSTTPAVEAISQIPFVGDIIPGGWYNAKALRFENGKPNLIAIMLLASICSWYRVREVKNEKTNAVIGRQRRFAADMLQLTYRDWAQRFGVTKRQIQDACAFLKRRKLIKVELRIVKLKSRRLNNIVFVEPNADKIRAITYLADPITPESDSYHARMRKGITSERNTPAHPGVTHGTHSHVPTICTQEQTQGEAAARPASLPLDDFSQEEEREEKKSSQKASQKSKPAKNNSTPSAVELLIAREAHCDLSRVTAAKRREIRSAADFFSCRRDGDRDLPEPEVLETLDYFVTYKRAQWATAGKDPLVPIRPAWFIDDFGDYEHATRSGTWTLEEHEWAKAELDRLADEDESEHKEHRE